MIKCSGVIVTYGDRFNLLKRVIKSCLNEGVDKLIVIDNNSIEPNKEGLLDLSNQLGSKLDVIWNSENIGSAAAFKQGLEILNKKKTNEMVWLLDDDNEPQKNSLKILKKEWKNKSDDVLCLLSYREDRDNYKKAIQVKDSSLVLGSKNSFLGFNFFNIVNSLFLSVFFKKKKVAQDESINIGDVKVAPYGGMFFHSSLIEKIGFPREDFFLYADDHEWSYRITKLNCKILLVLGSVIKDIDTSWNVKQKSIFKSMAVASPFRVYYSTRNRMVFEKENLVSNKFIYFVNRIVFTFLFITNNIGNLSKSFKPFKRAVQDALTNKLGKSENFDS